MLNAVAIGTAILLCLVPFGEHPQSWLHAAATLGTFLLLIRWCERNVARTLQTIPFYLVLWSFYLAFPVKGVIQGFFGFDTYYLWISLRTLISPEIYAESLLMTLVGGLGLWLYATMLATPSGQPRTRTATFYYLRSNDVQPLFLGVAAFLAMSTTVMWLFEVARMGTVGVSLPYKLSGVLYYGRTIVAPIVLLAIYGQALVLGRRRDLAWSLALLLLLSVSDTFVRASKSPLLLTAIMVVALYLILSRSSHGVAFRLPLRYPIALACAGLVIWPLVEAYRGFVTGDIRAMAAWLDSESWLVGSVVGPFNRIMGFPYFAGLLQEPPRDASWTAIWSADSIAAYYTRDYLGYLTDGHLSSPSLLGAAYLVGGKAAVCVAPAACAWLMTAAWSFAERFTYCRFAVRGLLVFEILNTVIAGTLDLSARRGVLILVCAAVFEGWVRRRRVVVDNTSAPARASSLRASNSEPSR